MSRSSSENRGVFFSASDHDRDFIHVLRGQKITTDRLMNNSASNKSSTQPSEERRKKSETKGHEQEIVDELVACGKDNTNTSYSGMTALVPAVLPSYTRVVLSTSLTRAFLTPGEQLSPQESKHPLTGAVCNGPWHFQRVLGVAGE